MGIQNDDKAAEQMTEIYEKAVYAMNSAFSEPAFKAAAGKFKSISGFRDADELAEICLEKAEICRKDTIYSTARDKKRKNTLQSSKEAVELYGLIPGWKDADKQKTAAEKAVKRWKIILSAVFAAVLLAAAALAAVVVYRTKILPNNMYNEAKKLYEAERYSEAVNAFKELDGYKDSEDMILLCEEAIKNRRYENALALMNEGRYKSAIPEFRNLEGYKESDQKLTECRYAYAQELYGENRFKEAVSMYMSVNGYLDSKERADEAYLQYRETEMKTAGVTDYVLFGTYEQDNILSNGKEYIEWRVLDKDGDRLLVVSAYGLDCKRYNTEDAGVSWADCSLRSWLNETFFQSAFQPDEQAMIQEVRVPADMNPEYNTPPGDVTTDRVFLLSVLEVQAYDSLDYARQCQCTNYCIEQGAYTKTTYRLSNDDIGWWWLRTPGIDSGYAAYALTDGSVFCNGRNVGSDKGAVRPAMWIVPES